MDIVRTRGDNYADAFQISKKDGALADLSGCILKMTLNTEKNPTDASTQLFQLVGIIEDPQSGVVNFQLTEDQANNVGYFYFDVQMTDPAGVVRTLTNGVYQFTQDITK